MAEGYAPGRHRWFRSPGRVPPYGMEEGGYREGEEGGYGREGFEKFFLGSVAETVAKKSRCSVEIVRQKQPHGVTNKNTATADSKWQDEVVC